MQLTENVRAAILRVTEVSKTASQIASRLGLKAGNAVTAAEVTDVEALKLKVVELTTQLADLRLLMSSTEEVEEFTPEQEAQIRDSVEQFTASLGTQSFTVIDSVYDEEYFLDYSRRMRFELCTALVNWCQTHKFVPNKLWYNIMVNNGSM
jgi:hypothetical protein